MISLITKYFHELSDIQITQLGDLELCYRDWNEKINVVSRKDIENLLERHVLHSLAIGKVISFHPGESVMDAGTGGGFPGIPLAILFPGTAFNLVDSTAKKLKVVNEVAKEIGLSNITTTHARLEEESRTYDWVVSRAVSDLGRFVPWVRNNIHWERQRSGILYLKGGDVESELLSLKDLTYDIYPVSKFFEEEFFSTKKVVHIYKRG